MEKKPLAQWRDELLVAVSVVPDKEGTATWQCPICHFDFEGIPVGQEEELAIDDARRAFVDHVTLEHDALIDSTVLT